MKRLLFLLGLIPAFSPAQQLVNIYPSLNSYTVTQETSLSSAAEVVTVQLPAVTSTTTKVVQFRGASVYCAVACDFWIERDGTVASTTASTPVPVNADTPAALATAYHSSNVGAGTVVSKYSLPAGGEKTFDLTQKYLRTPGNNLSIRTSSVTGVVRIVVQWSEQ